MSAAEMEVDQDVMDYVLLEELLDDDDGLLTQELNRGATMDNIEDWIDGTGRWARQGVPHEKRWWNKKAHHLPSALFRTLFRCR